MLAAAAARGLADPTRLRILALLESRGPMCLMDIMAALNLKQPIASHHTSVLLGLKMVDRVKDGRFMMYSLGRRSTRRVLDDIHAAIAAQQPQPADQGGADLVVIPEAAEDDPAEEVAAGAAAD